jgi:hypothetical protein
MESTAGDVIGAALRLSGLSNPGNASLRISGIRVSSSEKFADYFEPDVIYCVDLGLLGCCEGVLKRFGVDLTNAKFVMEMTGRFDIEVFDTKVAGITRTLVLVECQGTRGSTSVGLRAPLPAGPSGPGAAEAEREDAGMSRSESIS